MEKMFKPQNILSERIEKLGKRVVELEAENAELEEHNDHLIWSYEEYEAASQAREVLLETENAAYKEEVAKYRGGKVSEVIALNDLLEAENTKLKSDWQYFVESMAPLIECLPEDIDIDIILNSVAAMQDEGRDYGGIADELVEAEAENEVLRADNAVLVEAIRNPHPGAALLKELKGLRVVRDAAEEIVNSLDKEHLKGTVESGEGQWIISHDYIYPLINTLAAASGEKEE
jgi:cell division protein FtsB